MSEFQLPQKPYISLADACLQNHFTKGRLREHLRRAGLLNRHGRIVTEAEYENHFTNIEIGRKNRSKYDEAFLEVLSDIGEQQYKLLLQEMEKIKKILQYRFRQLEEDYARRTQPVKIRVIHDGRPSTGLGGTTPNINGSPGRLPRRSIESARRYGSESPTRGSIDYIEIKLNEFIEKVKIFIKSSENNVLLNLKEMVHDLQKTQKSLQDELELFKKSGSENYMKHIGDLREEINSLREDIRKNQMVSQNFEQLIQNSPIIKNLQKEIQNLVINPQQIEQFIQNSLTVNALRDDIHKSQMDLPRFEQFVRDSPSINVLRSNINKFHIDPAHFEQLVQNSLTINNLRQEIQKRTANPQDIEQLIKKSSVINILRNDINWLKTNSQHPGQHNRKLDIKPSTNDNTRRVQKDGEIKTSHQPFPSGNPLEINDVAYLQSIMPFVEPLPIVDMFLENEWAGTP